MPLHHKTGTGDAAPEQALQATNTVKFENFGSTKVDFYTLIFWYLYIQ